MSPRRTALALVGGLALAVGVAGAGGATPVPAALEAFVNGGKVVRAEVVVVNGGEVHDYRIDRGRVIAVAAGALTLSERDGTTQTVPLEPTALVTLNGRPVAPARLRPGLDATTVRDGDAGAAWVVATGRAKR